MEAGLGIQLNDVGFAYGKDDILDGITLGIPRGTFAALLGPNGAGKSTLLKTISGYLKPQHGEVLLCNRAVHSLGDRERSRLVTYLAPDSRSSFEFTVEEAVLMGRIAHSGSILSQPPGDLQAAEKAMLATKIIHLRNRTVTSLSSGEQQRVQIARAICQDPAVFLLDEPTAHLDMNFELEIMEMVKRLAEEGRTVFAIFHDVNLALRYASTILFMKQGRLVHSIHPEQVSSPIIEDVYGVKSYILEDSAGSIRCVVPRSIARP